MNTPYRTREGAKDGDRDFRLLWDGVSKIGIRGVYFYQRSGMSWQAQAQGVLDYLETLEIQPHMLWCDAEKIGNVIDATFIADAKRILDYWQNKAGNKYTIGLYANPDMVNNYYVRIGLIKYGKQWIDDLMKYPQWLAQYWLLKSPDKQPATYKTYPNWDVWQYSDKGDSFDPNNKTRRHYGSPDLNVYNGTVAEMKAWLKITDATPEPKPDVCPCCNRPL